MLLIQQYHISNISPRPCARIEGPGLQFKYSFFNNIPGIVKGILSIYFKLEYKAPAFHLHKTAPGPCVSSKTVQYCSGLAVPLETT